jgi:hypothetical protein
MSSVHRLDPRGPAIYRCAQAGCQDCLNQLLEYHEGLIHLTVRQQAFGRPTTNCCRKGGWRSGGPSCATIPRGALPSPALPA